MNDNVTETNTLVQTWQKKSHWLIFNPPENASGIYTLLYFEAQLGDMQWKKCSDVDGRP